LGTKKYRSTPRWDSLTTKKERSTGKQSIKRTEFKVAALKEANGKKTYEEEMYIIFTRESKNKERCRRKFWLKGWRDYDSGLEDRSKRGSFRGGKREMFLKGGDRKAIEREEGSGPLVRDAKSWKKNHRKTGNTSKEWGERGRGRRLRKRESDRGPDRRG